MSFARTSRFFRTALASALSAALVALAPGLAPYEAAAQVLNGAAVTAGRAAGATPAAAAGARVAGIPTVPAGAALVPVLNSASALTLGAPSALSGLAAPAASALAAVPALPASVIFSPSAAAAFRSVSAPAAAASEGTEPSARGRLESLEREVAAARESGAKAGVLDRFYAGMHRFFGLDEAEAPAAVSAAAPIPGAPAASALAPAGRAVAPAPIRLEGIGLQKGDKFLSGAAASTAVDAPKGEDWVDTKSVGWMFVQRSLSIGLFIGTSLAFSKVAYHVMLVAAVATGLAPAAAAVAAGAKVGVLMALGPLAAIATGSLNGYIIGKMSPRNGMTLLAVLRGSLAALTVALDHFHLLSFSTLLIASVANGWQLSLLMSGENAYFKRMAGKNKIGIILSLGALNYVALQVVLNSILNVGSFIDLHPMWAYTASAVGHLLVVAPLIFWKIPHLAPAAAAKAEEAAKSAFQAAADGVRAAASFVMKFRREIALFGLTAGVYLAKGWTLPMSGALLWWVSRTESFQKIWAQKKLRAPMILVALACGVINPFSYVQQQMGWSLGGAERHIAVQGQLQGAMAFGQMIANASQAALPALRIPGTDKTIPAQRLVQGVVLALAAAWSVLRLFPGNWMAAGASVAAGAALMFASSKITSRGWVTLPVLGLVAAPAAALMFWGHLPALLIGTLAFGLFTGQMSVVLNGIIGGSAAPATVPDAYSVNSSLINTSTSAGYGALTFLIGRYGLPSAMKPIAAIYALAGLAFVAGARFLSGLPAKSFAASRPPQKK